MIEKGTHFAGKEVPKGNAIVDQLKEIPHDVVGPLLDIRLQKAQAVDPQAGIVLVDLDEPHVTTPEGVTFHFRAARVLSKGHVNPHYHKVGDEPYHILTGEKGKVEMNLGTINNGKVEWRDPELKSVGDIIVVEEGEVHSLRNLGEAPLDFTFACPDAHLVDHSSENPEGDRFFTMDLVDGIPPQYPNKL